MKVAAAINDKSSARRIPGTQPAWDLLVPKGPSRPQPFVVTESAGDRNAAWSVAYDLIQDPEVTWAAPDGIVVPGHPLSTGGTPALPCLPNSRWARRAMHQAAAAKMVPKPREQVVIGHPDTGWADHYQLPQAALDLTRAYNTFDGSANAEDPVEPNDPFDGHGTCTASLMVSGQKDIDPAAPAAKDLIGGYSKFVTLVPVRCANNVIQYSTIALTRAIEHLTSIHVDVISISLGGLPSAPLQAALQHAVRNNIIVVAAGGQSFPITPFPAAYDECIAVAATTLTDRPWKTTTASAQVDISAPGHLVCVADFAEPGRTAISKAGSGTSYATPAVASAAALWIAKWGRQHLHTTYQNAQPLQTVFKEVLQSTARVPNPLKPAGPDDAAFVDFIIPLNTWRKDRYGAGIVDMKALLQAPLPAARSLPAPAVLSPAQHDIAALAHVLGTDGNTATQVLRNAVGAPKPSAWPVYVAETIDILMGTPAETLTAIRSAIVHPDTAERAATRLVDQNSASLKQVLATSGSKPLRNALT